MRQLKENLYDNFLNSLINKEFTNNSFKRYKSFLNKIRNNADCELINNFFCSYNFLDNIKIVDTVFDLKETFHECRSRISKFCQRSPFKYVVSHLKMLKDRYSIFYDPYMEGNIPSFYFNIDDVKVLRIPTPTIEKSLLSSVIITPEFDKFIANISYKGERLIYFNLQDRESKIESRRCLTLENLSNKYKNNFIVFNLAYNSAFYNQEETLLKYNFRDKFISEIIKGESFFIPWDTLKEFNCTQENIINILDELLKIIPVDEKKDRMAFIDIFYLLLQYYIISLIKPNYVNISCRDCVDRAGAANALLYEYTHGGLYSKFFLFAPALLIRKRPILESRMNRFLNAKRFIGLVKDFHF